MSGYSLDTLYGEAVLPKYLGPGEDETHPNSLHLLDSKSAHTLGTYLQTARDGLGLTKLNHSCFVILWLVDEDGHFWFALEEAFKETNLGKIHHPHSRDWALSNEHKKLGHPALLTATKRARIGGEIVYDPEFGEHGWVISNKSGRFGAYAKTQPPAQLDSVVRFWKQHGLSLDVHYIGSPD